MRGIVLTAALVALASVGCGKPSSHWAGVDEQPSYPLHVHPALSGAPPPPDMRARGRGTRGAPRDLPFVTYDYPDPPQVWATKPEGPDAIATGPRPTKPKR